METSDYSVADRLSELWSKTLGHEAIRIAVLDGPLDRSHPAFTGAKLDLVNSPKGGASGEGAAALHGTHVASVIFGQHDGAIKGIAPRCHGVIVPIFEDGPDGSLAPCSQTDLARAISQATNAGAHVISVSGGQLSSSGEAHPMLARAVAASARRGALIVAAAGNDGCACLHVPGALPSVLAVGAMNSKGEPLDFSNWGSRYRGQGILALGENIRGAKAGGGEVKYSGTSVATPVVSGIVALLLSWQLAEGRKPDPQAVRRAILDSALNCEHQKVPNCERLLMGRLNIRGAMSLLTRGEAVVTEQSEGYEPARSPGRDGASAVRTPPETGPEVRAAVAMDQLGPPPDPVQGPDDNDGDDDDVEAPPDREVAPTRAIRMTAQRSAPESPTIRPASAGRTGTNTGKPSLVEAKRGAAPGQYNYLFPSACSCGGGAPPQLVYALGQIYFDFGTDARRDSLGQAMGLVLGDEGNVDDPFDLLKYLDDNPSDSAAVIWTLNDETTPVYAIQAEGPYAKETYARLRQFFKEQLEEGVERVSIPGFLGGGKVRLYTGLEIPIIYPELRGMHSWTISALIESVCGPEPPESATEAKKREYAAKADELRSFLDRVYYDIRNMGVDPRDRAINYSATNAFNTKKVFEQSIKDQMSLDVIEVERSPICRMDSDCWDVKLVFFNPAKQFEVARKVFRFTVDVSDIVPVLVGDVRQWSVR